MSQKRQEEMEPLAPAPLETEQQLPGPIEQAADSTSSGCSRFNSNYGNSVSCNSSSSGSKSGTVSANAAGATAHARGGVTVETHKRSALDIHDEQDNKRGEESWNDFVMLEDHEFAHGYVAKFQRLCSRSELSISIHERVSARLELKRKLRLSRRFSFVEREKRARERHQEYLNRRRVIARKFIERRELVMQRQQRFIEERTKTLELRASRLDKRLLEQIEEDVASKTPINEDKQQKGKEEKEEQDSVDVGDDVFLHQKRAEENLATRIEGIQANLRKKMESADERRRQLREQEKVRLAKALQQVEKVQEKKMLEEEEKSIKLQEKLEEAEKRRRQLLEEESLRRKQKWEKREGGALSKEQELEERKKVLEERVELAIERKNRIIEETKLTIQKKLTDAEEQLNRNRSEMERKLQDMAEKIFHKQEKAEQLRIENLLKKKKAASPSRQARARGTPPATRPATTAVEEAVAG